MPDKRCCPVTSGAIAERVVVVYHVLPSVVRNEQKESMMTKADLVAQIAARANMTKAAAERSLNAMLESVQEMLAEDGKLTLTGFGTFVAETRQERQGRNPRTGDVITIAASKVVRFRPGKMLKDALNKYGESRCCTAKRSTAPFLRTFRGGPPISRSSLGCSTSCCS